jgi:Fe-S-cluster containining protein
MKIKVECKMCGKCCKAIELAADPIRLEGAKNSPGYEKLHKIFVEICKEEAYEINDFLNTNWKSENRHYYKCKKLKNGLCSIHLKGKPLTCSGYPEYKCQNPYGLDGPSIAYSKDCPFNLKHGQALHNGYKLTGKHYKVWKSWKDQEIAKERFLTAEEAKEHEEANS